MSTTNGPDDPVTTTSWQPLSARLNGTPIDQTWHEGIPPWIRNAVESWLSSQLLHADTADRLFARLRYQGSDRRLDLLRPRTDHLSEEDLLNWIDGILNIGSEKLNSRYGSTKFRVDVEQLDIVLREGHSIWKVSECLSGLERRQDATVTVAAQHAEHISKISTRPAAADHLARAWSKVYGLNAAPSEAYGEALLAVEAVAVSAITPNDPGATLGHVYGQLRTQGHLYELAITDKAGNNAPVDPVTHMIGLLWHGHTDRHEGNSPSIPIAQETAEMAVHAAVTLVQWFTSGAIRRR